MPLPLIEIDILPRMISYIYIYIYIYNVLLSPHGILYSLSSIFFIDAMCRREEGQIVIPKGPRLGTKVISVSNISKSMDDKCLLKNVSFEIEPNMIVGIVGPNGVGKSTLFRILTKNLEPDTGTVTLGTHGLPCDL
jgi:ABC-type multidrug transport system fused ATPase/permease subunit